MANQAEKNFLLYAGIGLGVYFLLKNIGNNLITAVTAGETPAEAAKVAREAGSISSPWNPNFYKNYKGQILLLSNSFADMYVQGILNSVGWFQDDFSQVLGIFKQLKTQSQVSYLADRFARYSGQDLLTWLQGNTYPNDRYSAEEVNQLIDLVKQLPKYMRS
jgi:hypothetical protein